jgi:uncharacterized protein YqgV (UPF0045/DUF77 family)
MEILELADPEAPYGLKGVGEPPTIASTPAVVAALRDATGRELPRVPVRPEQIAGIAREAADEAAAPCSAVRRDRPPRREDGAVVPAYERAELTAELKVVPSEETDQSPQQQIEAAKKVAGESGLGREAGPETTILTGGRREVLEAAIKVVEASLDAGAHAVEVRIEAQGEASSFTGEG